VTEPGGDVPKSSGGLMEDVIEIFTNPSALYERVRNSSFLRPALVQTVIFLVLALALKNLMAPFTDAEFARGMAKAAAKAAASGQPMPEGATAMAEKFKNVASLVGPPVLPWIIALLGGLMVWLCSKFVAAKLSFGQSMTVTSWSFMPAILGTITIAVFGLVMDPQSVRGVTDGQLGPGRFFDPNTTSPFVYAVLQRCDVFNLWSVALTGIGISVVGRVARSAGFIAAVVQWAIVVVIMGYCAGR
jgi:hypothetical protein